MEKRSTFFGIFIKIYRWSAFFILLNKLIFASLVFLFIYLFFSLNIAFAAEIKSKIKNVSITGLFENYGSDSYIASEYLLPVDGKKHEVGFTYDTVTYLISFTATVVGTASEKEEKYFSGEIKIEYFLPADSDFYKNDAVLRFKLYDKKGNILPIDEVIDYSKEDFISPGWILETAEFPANEVVFTTKNYGGNKGATERAWFILHCSYRVSES
ncbi:MAG: hypothetical protein AB1498_05360 [bacterium]